MGTSVDNLGKGGGKSKGVGDVFQGGGAGGTTFWGRDVGDDPHMGWSLGGFQHRVAQQITGRQP